MFQIESESCFDNESPITNVINNINICLLCDDDQISFIEVYQACVNFVIVGLIMKKVAWWHALYVLVM